MDKQPITDMEAVIAISRKYLNVVIPFSGDKQLYYDKKVDDELYPDKEAFNNFEFITNLSLKYAGLVILAFYFYYLLK